MDFPEDLRYTIEHEWVKKESDTSVRIGITDFAQDDLGDIVFIELPEVGEAVQADEPFGSVESAKTVSELYVPVSGTIVEVNENVEANPALINESPYEEAWMITVELDEPTELERLLTAEEYRERINSD